MTAGAAVPNSVVPNGAVLRDDVKKQKEYVFTMPLHYPRYSKSDYDKMPEWQLDRLLAEYGLPVIGDVNHKRNFAIGAFLWPSQY